MSCVNCEKNQNGRESGEIGAAYYRWKNGNVEIIACDTHTREIFNALNAAQKDAKEMCVCGHDRREHILFGHTTCDSCDCKNFILDQQTDEHPIYRANVP